MRRLVVHLRLRRRLRVVHEAPLRQDRVVVRVRAVLALLYFHGVHLQLRGDHRRRHRLRVVLRHRDCAARDAPVRLGQWLGPGHAGLGGGLGLSTGNFERAIQISTAVQITCALRNIQIVVGSLSSFVRLVHRARVVLLSLDPLLRLVLYRCLGLL